MLGNDAVKLERLRLQHVLWRTILLAALGRAAERPARWLEMFVTQFGSRPLGSGARMMPDPGSFWVGATILEVRARRT